MNPIFRYFEDQDCTKEADLGWEGGNPIIYNEEPIWLGETKRETYYARFHPDKPNLLFRADRSPVQVTGDAKLVEASIPLQLRPGDKFAITIEWTPKPQTIENLTALSAQVTINGQIIVPARSS